MTSENAPTLNSGREKFTAEIKGRGPRHTADTITDDELDALYERLTKAEQEADLAVAAAAQLTTLVGKRSKKAEKDAKAQRQRAKIAETELHVLRSGLRANGADPTQIQNLWAQIRLRNRQWREAKQRAEQAEAAMGCVRALHARVLRMEALVCAHCGHAWPCATIRAIGDPAATQATERHDDGPSVRECAATDHAHWNNKHSEKQP